MNARLTPSLFAHTETVLAQLLRFDRPADAVVSAYFRTHKMLGHADRGFVAESVFAVLRHLRSLRARAASSQPRPVLLLALVLHRGWNQRELAPILKSEEATWLAEVRGQSLEAQSAAVRCDLPDWLYEQLSQQMDAELIAPWAAAMNQPAPLDLRVNTLKASREAVLDQLAADGFPADPTPWSSLGIRLHGKPALSRSPLFLSGALEVQDEGSQLLSLLLEVRRGEMVADFCAGAGGKTLLLGAQMRNTGRLYAFDVSEKRLANLKPRLARSGLSNVHPIRMEHERDPKLKRLTGKFDRVLVDAPCSGLGTLRRNPDLKWRQTPEAVAELTGKQAAILAAAARLLRPGGRLVYATCSPLVAENEAIVADFLATHPDYSLIPVSSVLTHPELAGEYLRLSPVRHRTDGFFAALLERRA